MLMKSRIKSIFDKVEKDIDSIFIYNGTKPHLDMTFFYVTGLERGAFERCGIVLYPDGSGEMIISSLEEVAAKQSDIPITVFENEVEKCNWIKEKLSSTNRIGVNSKELTQKGYKEIKNLTNAKLVDISESISKARKVKDQKEIKIMKEACKLASEAAEEIGDYIEPGIKEFEIGANLSYLMKKRGAAGDAFKPKIASGPNSAEPHYTGGRRELKKGDFILMDFGALYRQYNSDITRTYFVGDITEKQRRMYNVVFKANKTALEMIEEGIKANKVHKSAEKVINNSEFKGKFIHSLGHSIGLSCHDGSGFSPSSNFKLEEGMILTVEPGVYIQGYGGVRIEDNILVTKNGCELLTHASKDLKII